MPSEPSWSQKISSNSVCTWFYILAIINLIFGTAGIVSALYLMSLGKYNMMQLLAVVLGASIGFTNTWSLFLVCNRGINA